MEINITLLYQLAIYLVIMGVLKVLYFDPIMFLLKKREAMTTGKNDEAARLQTNISELQVRYDEELKKTRNELEIQRNESLKSARESAEKKIKEAKVRAEAHLSQQVKNLEAELSKVRAQLPEMSAGISKEMVAAILSARVARS